MSGSNMELYSEGGCCVLTSSLALIHGFDFESGLESEPKTLNTLDHPSV